MPFPPPCLLAALCHIDQNGVYDTPLQRLWPQDFAPKGAALPSGIAFYLLPAPDEGYLPLLIAVAKKAVESGYRHPYRHAGGKGLFCRPRQRKKCCGFCCTTR
jgi:hypothetical protein